MKISPKTRYSEIFWKSLIGGLGWAIGATIVFGLVVYLGVQVLNRLGGLPIIGDWIAKLILVTNQALEAKEALP